MLDPRDIVIPAVDFGSRDEAMRFVESIPDLRWVKVGMQLQDSAGPGIFEELLAAGYKIFDDKKLQDIAKTVEKTAKVHCQEHRRPDLLNCLVDGASFSMLQAVAEVCRENGVTSVGVTVLTDQTPEEVIERTGNQVDEHVLFLLQKAASAGIEMGLCSPLELQVLNEDPAVAKMKKICPGVRPLWTNPDGQTRFATPSDAIKWGADLLVVGSPITNTEYGTPADNFARLCDEIATAL